MLQHFRNKCYKVMVSVFVERFILAAILINTATMAMQSPLASTSMLESLSSIDMSMSILFTTEAVARIYAMDGLEPYLSDAWNKLDFTIVVSCCKLLLLLLLL